MIDGKLVIREDQAGAVRMIYKLRNEGETMENIASKLNEAGFRNGRGNVFNYGMVSSILKNEKTYQGWYKYGDNDWVKGQHEPIL
ncbi:MAG: recombinase family protein [Saccharofermentanales bacterium]